MDTFRRRQRWLERAWMFLSGAWLVIGTDRLVHHSIGSAIASLAIACGLIVCTVCSRRAFS